MKVLKRILITIFIIIFLLMAGIMGLLLTQMYKPVFEAKTDIDEVGEYALTLDDRLVNREVKVIGVGEASHGNKEFQDIKLDVLKTLVRDNGVSAVCFEMDYAEGVLINRYIMGTTDMTLEEVYSHISFEIYHTEEIKNLIEWMREYNANSTDGCLEFYGIDIQNPEVDVYVIDDFVKSNNISLRSDAIDAYLANEFGFKDDKMNSVFDALTEYRNVLSQEEYANYADIDRILKCIDNVFTARELVSVSLNDLTSYGTFRDDAMTENVMEISEKVGYPIMITGHNGHVGYAGSYVRTMGSRLKEKLGSDYYVINTDYFKTTDSIKSDKGRKNHVFYSADPLAYQAKNLGTYYLRFDDVKDNEKLNAIVNGKMATGSLGESYSVLNSFIPATIRVYAPVTDLCDAMIFVYEATPITMLDY